MNLPRVACIAAMDRNRVIGKDNTLPWRLPNDLKRFKSLTLGHPVVMGRKTWESIGRPLPGRKNLVLSRDPDFNAEGATSHHSSEDALRSVAEHPWIFIIGGEAVYEAFLPLANRLYLTEVHTRVSGGDAFFPDVDLNRFQEVARETFPPDDRHPFAYDFVDYAAIGSES